MFSGSDFSVFSFPNKSTVNTPTPEARKAWLVCVGNPNLEPGIWCTRQAAHAPTALHAPHYDARMKMHHVERVGWSILLHVTSHLPPSSSSISRCASVALQSALRNLLCFLKCLQVLQEIFGADLWRIGWTGHSRTQLRETKSARLSLISAFLLRLSWVGGRVFLLYATRYTNSIGFFGRNEAEFHNVQVYATKEAIPTTLTSSLQNRST